MTDCRFCHSPIKSGQDLTVGNEHEKCSAKWHERKKNNECVRCGVMGVVHDILCERCAESGADYAGYEGP